MTADGRILNPDSLLEHAPAKAVIATTSTLGALVFEKVCHYNEVSGAVCSLVIGVPILLKLLIAMQGLDLVSGILAARADGERINSRRLSIGMKRKTFMLLTVAGALTLDSVFRAHGFDTGGLLFKGANSWFIATEALSLYENGERLGVPMPPFLKTTINALLQKAGQSGSVADALPTSTPKENS